MLKKEGVFMNNWINELTEEEGEFVRNFVLNSGSLKKLAKIYDVSYPTIRHKLDGIIDKLSVKDKNKSDFKKKVMQLVIDEDISFSVAQQILDIYEESDPHV